MKRAVIWFTTVGFCHGSDFGLCYPAGDAHCGTRSKIAARRCLGGRIND
jgi:hypothetical protein